MHRYCASPAERNDRARRYDRHIARDSRLDPFLLRISFRMSFGIYIGGIMLVVGGLVYAAAILHAPLPWIIVGSLVALGLGVLAAVRATRMRDAG